MAESSPADGMRVDGESEPDGDDPRDWARRYWSERDLPGDELPFVTLLEALRFQRMTISRIESQLRPYEVNLTDYVLLMSLVLSTTGARPVGRLAQTMMLHKTTVTVAADRMEKRGLIVRRPHRTDRRTTLVSVTADGRRLCHGATEALHTIGFSFDGDGVQDHRELVRLLARLNG
jgi:DNA-binding MarR family transcriptional regulator